ncbi:hypothetical protein [uncultured Rothia sp.]|uniref:hypothetical protein n=1 Tax=uncultured Rothia sp. TaxID=316088 RepID=UPI003216CBA3
MKNNLNKIILLSTLVLISCGLSLLFGAGIWRPWFATVLYIVLTISGWTFVIGIAIILSRALHVSSLHTSTNGFAHFMVLMITWVVALGGLLTATLYVFVFWLFSQPNTLTAADGTTIYARCQWLESKNCEYTKANSWFTRVPSDYQPSYIIDSTPENISSSPPLSGEPTTAEPAETTETPSIPLSSEVAEDSIIATSASIPQSASAEEFGIFASGNNYYSAAKINRTWVTGGEISPISMHKDIYNIFALDDSVWLIGFGTPHGGETYFSTDAGQTWSTFSPVDFEQGEYAPSFLESALKNTDGYVVTMNYPSWVSNAGDGVVYYSANGADWEKK